MKYQVINAMTLDELTKEVAKAIGDGWEPGIGFWAGPRGFYQPMIKRNAEKESTPKRAA